MCDTPPNSLVISDSVHISINEKENTKLLDESTALFIETNSNESNSMEVTSSNSCQAISDRATRNSGKITSRFTRSRDNPEFVAKQKNFMAQVQAANLGIEVPSSKQESSIKRKRDNVNSPQPTAKKKKIPIPDSSNNGDRQNDSCCWECHKEGQFICCEMCPRVFHLKCVGMEKEPEDDWACQECHSIMLAENFENRSRSMQLISVDQLCILLKFALNRIRVSPALSLFCMPVDLSEFPTYRDMIIHPLDLQTLEKNIKKKLYGSTEAFLADARWIYHNCVIFNGANSKITALAKSLIKILRQELSEIETCPDCYQNAHLKPDSWFTEACRLAHPLVWAKLKGFPYWPAKAVKWKEGNVDVRFFGRHDRSWVQLKDCCLYSEQMPTTLKSRNKTLELCLVEVKKHIENLKEMFGEFKYAPHRIIYDPHDTEQIKLLLPFYKGPTILKIKPNPRTASRQSQSSTDDDNSSVTSSDSYSVYGRKLSLIECSPQLPTEEPINQDDKETKIDDSTEELETNKSDPITINDTQPIKKDVGLEGKKMTAENNAGSSESRDDDADKIGVENSCEDGLHCDKEKEEKRPLNFDTNDTESNLINADEDLRNPDKEVNAVSKKDNLTSKDTKLDEELPMESSEISMKQAVKSNLLLDNELGLKKAVTKEPSTLESKINTKTLSKEGSSNNLPLSDKCNFDGAPLNESIMKLECINALLASPNNDETDTVNESLNRISNEEKDSNIDGLFSLDSTAKSDSVRSSIDENSFPGFGSEEDTIKEKAESCKSILKCFRLNSLLKKDYGSQSENPSDISKDSTIVLPRIASPTVENIDSDKPVITPSKDDNNVQKEQSPSFDLSKTVNTPEPSVESTGNCDDNGSESVAEEDEEDPLLICQSSPIDIKSYTSKMFHNVTVSSSHDAEICKQSKESSRSPLKDATDTDVDRSVNVVEPTLDKLKISDTLMAAVKLVQNIGNIEIKRVDNKTLEHTSGNDKITISVANNNNVVRPQHERAAPKSVKEARKALKSSSQVQNKLAAMGSSVCLAKATDSKKEDKTKMPSGIDTTRLSPSISIIPVATTGSNEKQRIRCTSTVSVPHVTTTAVSSTVTTTTSLKSGSPLITNSGCTTPCSNNSISPSVPPPLLSHPMTSTGAIRGMLGGHLPLLQGFQNNPRTPMVSPSMRMMGPNPAMMLANRLSGGMHRPSPPEAGPLSAELSKHSVKLADMMRTSMEEVIGGLVGMGSPEARLAALQLELEKCNWRHQQEMADVRHNADVMMVEIRANMEAEKQRAIEDTRKQVEGKICEMRRTFELQANERIVEIKKQCETEKKREVDETKKKQWCANCQKEALLFCCWNTSYCDYPCQQNHWPQHMSVCGQNAEQGTSSTVIGDSEMDATNGDTSAQSSGLSTPIHSNLGSHFLEDEESLQALEERKRKKRKENPSPIFVDPLNAEPTPGTIIASGFASTMCASSINKPMSSLGPGLIRPHITSPGMPMGLIGSSPPIGMHMKLPRFLPHSMMQPQQNMFGAMDPRMVMMIGRGMGNPAMMRGHIQPFRPRFM